MNDEGTNSLTILDHNLKADFGKNTELIELNLENMYEENDNGQFVNMFIESFEKHSSFGKRRQFLFLE
jgi:hypothetical protein